MVCNTIVVKTFREVLSEEPEGSAWAGARGLVTEFISEREIPGLSNHYAYLCGPPPMIDAAIHKLSAVGIEMNRIHYDKFLDASNLV